LCRTNSSQVSKVFLNVLALDAGHLLLAKAYCEGQTATALSMASTMAASVNAQVSNAPPVISEREQGFVIQGCTESLLGAVRISFLFCQNFGALTT
jgi:hypothetical protein